MEALTLSPEEARVLAALAEKAFTTPKYYPMSVNAVMVAANQKNCRNPVMNLGEGDVGAALNRLEGLELCRRDDRSGRVVKWRHELQHYLLLKPEPFALLVTLMLRGPQTPSELRANAAGLGGPRDNATTEALLQDLADRSTPLVTLLPRAPGRKEARYAHTLCGVPEADTPAATATRSQGPAVSGAVSLAALEERIAALEERVAQLERAPGEDPQQA